MADLTKIVPSTITSSLTVSEVNGISLTKSKQNTESSLPASTFAEILEAQLSQNNIQTEETSSETKQILPGQSVDTSLFGSLIVVVRDVEVPISDNQEISPTKENSRLFIPTVFTASTSSAIAVSQPLSQKNTVVHENNVESNRPTDILTKKTSQDTTQIFPIDQPKEETTQSVTSNPSRITPTEQTTVTASDEETNTTQNIDSTILSGSTVAINVNSVDIRQTNFTQQPIGSNIPSIGSESQSTMVETTSDLLLPTISSKQTTLSPDSNLNNDAFVQKSQNTVPFYNEKSQTVQPVSNSNEAPLVPKSETVSSPKQVTEASPRTLSSMLQSVQGLKMGIERTPTQQTFITVALPISEVQRLVVANPEVFTPKQQLENGIPNESTVVSNIANNNEGTIYTSNKTETKNFEVSQSENESIDIQTAPQNRENVFVPTSFIANRNNDNFQSVETKSTDSTISTQINPQEGTQTVQQSLRSITSTNERTTVQVVRPQPKEKEVITTLSNTKTNESTLPESKSTTITVENNNESDSVVAPKQHSFESMATTIENFATNLQSISSPISTNSTIHNSRSIENQRKEPVEFPFHAKIETISDKNTLVLEPLQNEGISKPNQKVDQPIEPKFTITTLLQKADSEGMAIESIVVKIPVQTSKNTEVTKETVSISQKPTIPSALMSDTAPKGTLIETTTTKELSIPTNLSQPTGATKSSQDIPNQTIPTSVQKEQIASTTLGSKVITPVENFVAKATFTKNDVTTSPSIGKEVNVQQNEPSSNTQSEQNNLPPRRDVASILQRVENIHQKSANNEVNNQTSTTNTTEIKFNNQVTSPKVTPNLSGTDTIPTAEVITNKPIEVKNTPIVEESNEQELSNELVNHTFVGVNQVIKTTTPAVPVVDAKIIETPVSVEELPKAIVQEFVTDTTAKGSKATFTLNPEQLGKVQVEVTVKDNTASITLESSQKETIPMLEKQIDTLKEQLKTSNIIVEKLEVLFKPAEIVQPSTTMNDTFTSSQQMEQQSLQQEVDKQTQQQQRKNQQQTSFEVENTTIEEIQPKRFGDGSSIIEEYI